MFPYKKKIPIQQIHISILVTCGSIVSWSIIGRENDNWKDSGEKRSHLYIGLLWDARSTITTDLYQKQKHSITPTILVHAIKIKKLWVELHKNSSQKKQLFLPSHTSNSTLADSFTSYFSEKINIIFFKIFCLCFSRQWHTQRSWTVSLE